jgi:hypothetical protein
MDLGLFLRMAHRSAVPGTGGRRPPERIGDLEIDTRYAIQATEHQRARALLAGELRAFLLRPPDGLEVQILDHNLSLESPAGASNAAALVRAVRAALRCAHLVDQARGAVPAASRVKHHASAWHAFARSHALRAHFAPPCVWGSVHGTEVVATACRKVTELDGFGPPSITYPTRVRVSFPQFLGLRLAIRPQTGSDRVAKLFGRQDVRLEDREFDNAFLVQTKAPERVRELLEPAVRAGLLAVAASGASVTADDEAIEAELGDLPPDPAIVPTIVEQLATSVEAMGRRAGLRGRAPYR